ncbi:DUF6924 domain-containing protein [Nocardioides campestrisoli]|uniref:DUF6924 domain-containing protein n=1 Tax=Nocardioides campestrisoli TaxID=2736757 RepID=UPI00163D4018|nr:hypothetical protein [Nocardioides campestrisoli]
MNLTQISAAFEDAGTPLIRTDFASDSAWSVVVEQVTKPVDFDDPDNTDPGDDGYVPYVVIVDDPEFTGVDGPALAEALPTIESGGYVLLADARCMEEATAGGELTLAYVDLSVSDPEDAELFNSFMGRTFRCAVAEIASIEANLSIANMDFHEFADNAYPDGVFRGFAD